MTQQTKEQHTPGITKRNELPAPDDFLATKLERIPQGAMSYAEVTTNYRKCIAERDRLREVNARLIAAAPDTTKGCAELVDILHATNACCGFGVPFTPQNNPCGCTQHQSYHAARAAIAKARGTVADTVEWTVEYRPEWQAWEVKRGSAHHGTYLSEQQARAAIAKAKGAA